MTPNTASADGTVIRWNLNTGEQIGQFALGTLLGDVAVGPGGRWAVASDYGSSSGGSIVQFDVVSGAVFRRMPARAAWRLAISPDGQYVLTTWQNSSTARLWEVASGHEVARLVGHRGIVNWAAFTPDGQRAVTTSKDGTVRVWDVAGVVGR